MVIKIYALAWTVLLAATGLLFYTGHLNDITMTILGFIFATLAFMGIIAVLPWWVDKQYSWNH